ncbi:acylphosphatase [Rubripirellula reticaptiva]|uniref:acylphosphatase n=1 Tax=Rubripirellula reticaptiva TaxID=2528013 RepID=A0A5C6EGU3_9BACT|nr:acylphosphatase [Rubripirellula reticaptiva]TWU47760.1 Acylphosphatase [Rubripirellula reticaptiva]
MSIKPKRVHVQFTGHVQGVGFRMTVVEQSVNLAVHGFVQNEPDGSVTLDAEGSPADLKELIRRIKSAMSGKIDGVSVDDREPLGKSVGGIMIRR